MTKILIKRVALEEDIPVLADRQMCFAEDTGMTYIGTGAGNELFSVPVRVALNGDLIVVRPILNFIGDGWNIEDNEAEGTTEITNLADGGTPGGGEPGEGIVPIAQGGTSADNAPEALDNLGAVPETRTLSTPGGSGLTGGGSLAANRSLALTDIAGVAGSYIFPASLQVDGKGRITSVVSGEAPEAVITSAYSEILTNGAVVNLVDAPADPPEADEWVVPLGGGTVLFIHNANDDVTYNIPATLPGRAGKRIVIACNSLFGDFSTTINGTWTDDSDGTPYDGTVVLTKEGQTLELLVLDGGNMRVVGALPAAGGGAVPGAPVILAATEALASYAGSTDPIQYLLQPLGDITITLPDVVTGKLLYFYSEIGAGTSVVLTGSLATAGPLTLNKDDQGVLLIGGDVWRVVGTFKLEPDTIVKNEGTVLTRRKYINFIGSNINAVDNPGTDSTDVTTTPTAFSSATQDFEGDDTIVFSFGPQWKLITIDGAGATGTPTYTLPTGAAVIGCFCSVTNVGVVPITIDIDNGAGAAFIGVTEVIIPDKGDSALFAYSNVHGWVFVSKNF